MSKYHKIPTVYMRNPENRGKTLIEGAFATPELEMLAGLEWEWTEKVDGTNIRVCYNQGRVIFGGREENSQAPFTLMNQLNWLFQPTNLSSVFGIDTSDVVLYGEGYGRDIQKAGKLYLPHDVGFILFDVKIGDLWLERKNVVDIANKLNVAHVPVQGRGTLFEAVESVRLWRANPFPSKISENGAVSEGLVMRPSTELLTRTGERIIAKIKVKDFPA
jgi:ATP-dependent RNA circularization protein (DNA/RNA ligase family)